MTAAVAGRKVDLRREQFLWGTEGTIRNPSTHRFNTTHGQLKQRVTHASPAIPRVSGTDMGRGVVRLIHVFR